jgi:hypothetical protein
MGLAPSVAGSHDHLAMGIDDQADSIETWGLLWGRSNQYHIICNYNNKLKDKIGVPDAMELGTGRSS